MSKSWYRAAEILMPNELNAALAAAKKKSSTVDVSAEGMKKQSKTLARGTGVTYSGIRTSSQGLLTGAKTEKKTLLGG
jgi:hypothetical protein